ncbi:MAG: zinc transporter ZupT [Candidatus Lokiarchaeota archaeon]|nr:zinc transporter ZupT [Candidatus Lokiarchaeota archaeon]
MIERFIFAIILSLIAGLSTSIGGLFALFFKEPGPKFLSFIMGFSAGVMLFISFVELLGEGIDFFGILGGTLFLFVGMGIMFVIDMAISHKYHIDKNYFKEECTINERLEQTSFFVFLGIFIHNIPEGMATLVGTLESIELGLILAIAIAIHNIPEGIAVAVPNCANEGNRKKAFFMAFLSGMSEPIGAFIFGIIFIQFITDAILVALLVIVAGIMIYVSIDELLPVGHCFGNENSSIIGIVGGMFIMALSLYLL